MENGERSRGLCGLLSAIATVMAAVALTMSLGVKIDIAGINVASEPTATKGNVADVAANAELEGKYTAKTENGRVVVRNTDGEAVKTLDTPVRFMTKADREYFEKGAVLYSDEELAALIDDFSG
ncbi:MAG: hypothetical protein J5832_03565 [Clostridia bacterium]|nr:hypothetical protein [Clostridia bacterium]